MSIGEVSIIASSSVAVLVGLGSPAVAARFAKGAAERRRRTRETRRAGRPETRGSMSSAERLTMLPRSHGRHADDAESEDLPDDPTHPSSLSVWTA